VSGLPLTVYCSSGELSHEKPYQFKHAFFRRMKLQRFTVGHNARYLCAEMETHTHTETKIQMMGQ